MLLGNYFSIFVVKLDAGGDVGTQGHPGAPKKLTQDIQKTFWTCYLVEPIILHTSNK